MHSKGTLSSLQSPLRILLRILILALALLSAFPGFGFAQACERPGVPVIGSATPGGANRIDVSWSNGTPESESFNVYRAEGTCASHGPFVTIAEGKMGFVTYQDTTVSGGTSYAYHVTGFLSGCESSPSDCVEATTTGECTLAPLFAGLQTVTNPEASTCALDLSWSAATPRCGGDVTYNVYRNTMDSFVPSVADRIADGLSGVTFQDPGPLTSSQTYYYIVRAFDTANGAGDVNTVRVSGAPTGASGAACQSTPPEPLDFYTLVPCRLFDTRIDVPALQPLSQRTFTVTGICGVPSTAKALSLSLTAIEAAAPGYLTLFPGDLADVPTVSAINFRAGLTRANNAITQVSSDGTGQIIVFNGSNGTVHMVLDVNGYFE